MNKYGVACPLIFIQILSREIGANAKSVSLVYMLKVPKCEILMSWILMIFLS